MEVWKPVMGYEGLYEVSNFGRIKSFKRGKGFVLSLFTYASGYIGTRLVKNGVGKTHPVHQLVCKAFHGQRPKGKECAHLDGTRDNNTPENLCWVTPKENHAHRKIHGTYFFGERHPRALLTEVAVISIKQEFRAGRSAPDLAKEHGVCRATINKIMQGKHWKHIP